MQRATTTPKNTKVSYHDEVRLSPITSFIPLSTSSGRKNEHTDFLTYCDERRTSRSKLGCSSRSSCGRSTSI